MSEEEINKLLDRVEQDKLIDRCGFEFADGYSCTFENTAICYDDRLKLYYIVKKIQQENKHLKDLQKNMDKQYEKLENNWNELKKWLIQLQKFKGINQQGFSWGVAQEVLDKMQELEGNNE